MKEKVTTLSRTLILVLFIFTVNSVYSQTSTPPAAGDGTEGNPYQIETLDNLYWLSQSNTEWDKHYIQTADINASPTVSWEDGAGFTPIGNSDIKFTGKYDGNGHIISHLFIDRPDNDYVGLFRVARDGALITNLGLMSIHVTGSSRVGGLIGALGDNGTITNCYVEEGTIICTDTYYSNGGGLAGVIAGVVNACYASVNVFSEGNRIGGFVGQVGSSASISNCYSTGNVENNTGQSDGRVGGFCGDNEGTIINCYSTGIPSTADDAIGGFNGYMTGTMINCFWDIDSSEISTSNGGSGLTSEEMKNVMSFINAEWDFAGEITNGTEDIWGINCNENDGYPFLMFQEFAFDGTLPVADLSTLPDVTGDCAVTSIAAPTATDNCDGTITGVPNVEFPITQQTVVTWSYTDYSGNSTTQTQNVIIDDATPPTLTCASNLTVNANSEGYYTVQGTELDPTDVDDNCGVASVLNDYNDAASLADAQVPEGTHTIIWTVTDNAGNDNTCSLDLTVNAHETGVANLQQAGINLYPNPTAQMLTVELGQNRALRLTLTDLTGRVVLTKENPSQTETLDLSPLSNGVYLLVVQTNGKVLSTRVVKK